MGKKNQGEGAGAEDLPVLVNPKLMKGLEHVLRQHVLLATVQGEISPKEIAKRLGESLSRVSYHVRVLRDDCGLIVETRAVQRRGAIEHYYRATAKALLPAEAWRGLKGGLRAAVGAGMASDLFNDLAGALKADKLQGKHDHVTRIPLALDEEGRRKVHAIAQRAKRDAEREQGKAADRMAKSKGDDGKAKGYVFAVCAFEAAWQAVEPPDATAPAG